MSDVFICGVGMTRFAKYPEKSLKQLGRDAVHAALSDAGIEKSEIQAAFVSNSMAGIVTGQEAIRGQVVLSAMGINSLPIVNVENACASGATALHQAWTAIRAGLYDVVLVLGVEKLFHEDRSVSYRALSSATDVETTASEEGKSVFLEESSRRLLRFLESSGATIRHVAKVAEKSHRNSSLNPLAQYREAYSIEQIMASPMVSAPLTRLMCSPIGDGSAALIVCSEGYARKIGCKVRIRASLLRSAGPQTEGEGIAERSVKAAYELAGLGPEEIDAAEVHDTTAASELMLYGRLAFCRKGDEAKFVDEGDNKIGGRLAVNPSGGLISRGHPVGATGVAQICELTWQLRGQAGARQISKIKAALAHNAGGTILGEPAALGIHILTA